MLQASQLKTNLKKNASLLATFYAVHNIFMGGEG